MRVANTPKQEQTLIYHESRVVNQQLAEINGSSLVSHSCRRMESSVSALLHLHRMSQTHAYQQCDVGGSLVSQCGVERLEKS